MLDFVAKPGPALAVLVALLTGCAGNGKVVPRTLPEAAAPQPPQPSKPVPSDAAASPSEKAKTVADAPELTLGIDDSLSEDLIRAKLLRGRALLTDLEAMTLESGDGQQLEIGSNLLDEAEQALAEGDLGRADVLSAKALALLEDLFTANRQD